MKRYKNLSREAREFIKGVIRDHGKMTRDEAVAIVEPHYIFDPTAAKRREILRVVQSIMASIRSETGKRECFNYKDAAESVYINVETTNSVESLDAVEAQIDKQLNGLYESKRRIARRREVLNGQIEIEKLMT